MYTLSSPPHLPWAPLPSHNPTPTCRRGALAAINTRHSASAPASTVPLVSSSGTLDPALRSTWAHRAWVVAGSATVLDALTNSVIAAADSGAVIEPVLAALLGYVLADLGTGIYHFAIDNYGGPSTPIFGSQIEAFQGHHRRPATITRRQPANNLHALAATVALAVAPLELLVVSASHGRGGAAAAAAHAFIGVCGGCVMLSQQFHAWAHGAKGRVPRWVEALQRAGVLISRDMHGAHHRVPYNSNYCIVSGVWNWVLDEYRVFEMIEMVVYFKLGVRPRSWGETTHEWREENTETIV